MHFSKLKQQHLNMISCTSKTELRHKIRFTAHLNSALKLTKAIPKLIMLVQFLTVLTTASAIGGLHHYGTR